MELPTKAAGFHKVRNLPVIQAMQTRRRKIRSRIDRVTRAAALAVLLICGLPSAGYAQATSTDQAQAPQAQTPKKTAPDAGSLPATTPLSGDAKTGVVKPPDVDPKMAKQVPDVDPGMTHPPPDKSSAPTDPSVPKAQPK
jgi:hypothetical protein